MPKMIGNWIEGATQIDNNMSAHGTDRVRLSYSQAVLLPASAIEASLDTTDRGGPKSLAKRWYRWFASADAIEACPRSTKAMRAAAYSARHPLAAKPLRVVVAVPPGSGYGTTAPFAVTSGRDLQHYTERCGAAIVAIEDGAGVRHPVGGELAIALEVAFATLGGALRAGVRRDCVGHLTSNG